MEQGSFIRLNVGRFRELLGAELPQDSVRTVLSILAECEARPLDGDRPETGEFVGPVSQLVHEASQPLTAISSYIAACRHLVMSGKLQRAETALNRSAEQVHRAWEVMKRLRQLVN